MIQNVAVGSELKRIANDHNGCLQPQDVVDAARSETSPIHSFFDWDDTEAAEKWRVHQARNLIRVTVEYIGGDDQTLARVFVSLTPDRQTKEGYRATAAVMNNKQYREQLLTDALNEMKAFQAKYASLKELDEVFKAIKATSKKLKHVA